MTIKLNAATGGGSVSLSAPNSTTSNLDVALTLPVDDGTSGQVLQTDGSGVLSWATASSDNITEGNTSAEVIDTGSDGRLVVTTEGTERFRVSPTGTSTYGDVKVRQVLNDVTQEYTMMNGPQSRNIYVSDSGSDTNDGLSGSAPVRTLNQAWRLIPKLGWTGQAVSIRIMGTTYNLNQNTYLTGSFANGDKDIGPYININGDTTTVQLNVNGYNFSFWNCAGIRFSSINFYFNSAGNSLRLLNCKSIRFYNSCVINSDSTSGWSVFFDIANSDDIVWEGNINVSSSASAGLGGAVVIYNSRVQMDGTMTKSGTRFGNTAIAVCNNSQFEGGIDVNNFQTGIWFGTNHYNAESGSRGMLNGVSITNCVNGIQLSNHSYVRKYSVSYSGNTTNEAVYAGAFT